MAFLLRQNVQIFAHFIAHMYMFILFLSLHRYCIDGGALLFVPNTQSADGDLEFVRGDLPPVKRSKPLFQG